METMQALKENLIEKGYKVSVFEDVESANEYLDKEVDAKTVAFGGSVTLTEMGLYDKLITHNKVLWHARIPEGKTANELREEARLCQVYFSSVNGISEDGIIINIDGAGNRVSSTIFGHEKVYLVIGKNKIAKDYESALFRARNIAAPKNAQRLKKNTPCAKNADRCYDCKSEDRICKALVVFWEKPRNSDVEIILINEDLGY